MRFRPFALVLLVLPVLACHGDGDESDCAAACEAVLHFTAELALAADIDQFTFNMCGNEACVEFDVDIPADEVLVTEGEDPAVTLTVTRTDQDHQPDDQGIFAFDATWTSSTVKLEPEDFIRVNIIEPDGGNIAGTLRDLDPEETVGTCGCGTFQLDL